MRNAFLFAALIAAALAGGCAPTLHIVGYVPGRIEPRGGRALVLVEGEGLKDARDVAARMVDDEAAGTWWRVDNRGDEGVKLVVVDGEKVQLVGETRPLRKDELWARVDVVEWTIVDTVRQEEDEEGNVTEVPVKEARVMFQVTVADREGRVLLLEEQYRSEVVVPAGEPFAPDPLLDAARTAAQSVLRDISPQRTGWNVRLDDTDSGQKRILEQLVKGTKPLREIERKLRRYLKKNEKSAIARYNLAVVLDAEGKHEEALVEYDAAMKIHSRDYYLQSRADCSRRAEAKKAVFGEPPVPVKPAAPAASSPTSSPLTSTSSAAPPRAQREG